MANPRIPYRLSSTRAKLPPFRGKRIVAHLVVNAEHWPFEHAMPRTLITPPHGRETIPDVPNLAWADCGMRAGLSRLLRLFGELVEMVDRLGASPHVAFATGEAIAAWYRDAEPPPN
jgi:hypothetical protein